MKKKILFGAVIAAALFGLVSCKPEVGDIKWDGGALGSGDGTPTYTVTKQTNEGKDTIRGMKRFDAIPRAKATCIIQLFNQSKTTRDGMMGFATYVTEDKVKKTMNFLVVGVTNNKGKTETYASYFCNVDPEKLSTKNFGVDEERDAFDPSIETPYEVVIVRYPAYLNNVTLDEEGTLKLAIDFTGNSDGSVDIKWYTAPILKSGDKAGGTFDLTKCTVLKESYNNSVGYFIRF